MPLTGAADASAFTTQKIDELDATQSDAPSPAQLHLILKRLLDQRCMLTVQVGKHADCYTSAVLEVAREARYLVLDELIPAAGHQRILREPTVQLRARLDGVEVRFHTYISQIGEQGGLPYYKVPFPATLEYSQRRQAFRVPIPLNRGIRCVLLLDDEREFSGELRDLSPSGLGIRVRTGEPNKTTDQGQLAICRIELGEDRGIVTDVELCHIDQKTRGRVARLGLRFRGLRPEQQRRIEQFCAELAREHRRLR